jgi:hypothetical protein
MRRPRLPLWSNDEPTAPAMQTVSGQREDLGRAPSEGVVAEPLASSRRRTVAAYTTAIGNPTRKGAPAAWATTQIVRRCPLVSHWSCGRSDGPVSFWSSALP